MINRSLVRKKSVFLVMGRLFPAALLVLMSYVVSLAISRLGEAVLKFMGGTMPDAEALLAGGITEEQLAIFAQPVNLMRIGIAALICAVLTFLLLTPFNYGTLRWYLSAANEQPQSIGYAFSSYGSIKAFFSALWLYFYTGLRKLLWAAAVFLLPLSITGAAVYFSDTEGYELISMLLMLIGVSVLIGAYVLYVILTNRYFMTPYICAKYNDISPVEALRLSTRVMKPYIYNLLVLQLSLIPFILIGQFVCAGALFILPFVNMCYAVYATELMSAEAARMPGDISHVDYKVE